MAILNLSKVVPSYLKKGDNASQVDLFRQTGYYIVTGPTGRGFVEPAVTNDQEQAAVFGVGVTVELIEVPEGTILVSNSAVAGGANLIFQLVDLGTPTVDGVLGSDTIVFYANAGPLDPASENPDNFASNSVGVTYVHSVSFVLDTPAPAFVSQCPPGYTLVPDFAFSGPQLDTYRRTFEFTREAGAPPVFPQYLVIGTPVGISAFEQLFGGATPAFTIERHSVPFGARLMKAEFTGFGNLFDQAQFDELVADTSKGPSVPRYLRTVEGVAPVDVGVAYTNLIAPTSPSAPAPLTLQLLYGTFQNTVAEDLQVTLLTSQANEVVPVFAGIKAGTTAVPVVQQATYQTAVGRPAPAIIPDGGLILTDGIVAIFELNPSTTLKGSGKVFLEYSILFDRGVFGSYCRLDAQGENRAPRQATAKGQEARYYNSYKLVPPGQTTLPPQTGGPTPV